MLSAEDSWSYVLRARLEANGADLERISYISPEDDRFVDLNFDGDLLRDVIETVRPSAVIFDPLQAFVPPNLRMGDRNAMRKCFSPLIGYGEKYGLTSIIIAHANKQSGVWGRKRIADSSDIWDSSRSVLRNIRPVVEDAKDFIIETLTEHKQMEVSELDELAAANSISKNALKDAKAALKKEGLTRVWNVGYGKTKKFVMELKDAEKSNE